MNMVSSVLITVAVAFGAQFFSGAVYSAEVVGESARPDQVIAEKNPEEIVESQSAHQVLEATTKRLMSVITEAQTYFIKDPDRFYGEIELILDEVVDFDSFARGVMGKYASKQVYMKLASAEEKEAFKGRMNRFSGIFRDELVKTYAKGLLAFNGNRIDILPPAENDLSADSSVTVIQHIYGAAEKPYVVRYKMKQDSSGQWKLRNLTIEAINLGKIYRSQFYSAAKLYNDDIDRVIDGWSVAPGA
jgi:phospholipid transport system substrate-binding protein